MAATLLVTTGCDAVFGLDQITSNPPDAHLDGSPTGIKYIQSASDHANNVVALPVAFAVPPAAGSLVVVALATFQGDLATLTDSDQNVYVEGVIATSPAMGKLAIYYATAIRSTSAPFVVTATVLASTVGHEVSMAIHEYAGVAVRDQHTGTTGIASQPSCGPVTPTSDLELVVAAVSHDAQVTTTAGAGFALRQIATDDTGTFVPLATEDQLDARGPITATFTLSEKSDWACALVTFR